MTEEESEGSEEGTKGRFSHSPILHNVKTTTKNHSQYISYTWMPGFSESPNIWTLNLSMSGLDH